MTFSQKTVTIDTETKSFISIGDGSREAPEGTRLIINNYELLEAKTIMKLNYRGVSYEYNPPTVETAETDVAGKYRGLDWRFRNLKKPPVIQAPVNLTYRGVTYNNQPTATQTDAPKKVSQQARRLMLNRQRASENRSASMLVRSAQALGLV